MCAVKPVHVFLRDPWRKCGLQDLADGGHVVFGDPAAEIENVGKKKGFTIILVEQNFHFAADLADRHYVIDHGAIAEMITKDELASSMEKLNQYLGV